MSDTLQKLSGNEETQKGSSFDEDENDIGLGDQGSSQSQHYETSSTKTCRNKPPASSSTLSAPSSRPSRRHHPPPSLPTSPKTKAHSPISSRLKHHFSTQSSDWSTTEKEPTATASPTLRGDFQQKHKQQQQQQQQQQDKSNNSHHHNHEKQTKPISSASLVVCGVDGTVYTLDAYTGQLRGMFASGPALVYSSSPDGENNDDTSTTSSTTTNNEDRSSSASNVDYSNTAGNEEENAIANTSPRWKERIVPGLDGRLYNLFQMNDGHDDDDDDDDDDYNYINDDGECSDGFCEKRKELSSSIMPHLGSYNLSPLPISVMDVVDSPISTCRPRDDPSQQQQCGIVVGSKKTTVYALDPTTGKVQWTQDPHGGGGGRGFTKHPPPKGSSRGLTVLLQREDYAVRHLNTDGGGEVWKVELGRFSALDFDVDAHRGDREDEMSESRSTEEDDHVVVGSRRGTAAAATRGRLDKKTTPILGGTRRHGALHENKEHRDDDSKLFHQEDSFEHDHSHFRGFPSVAFGEDGTTLMAVDGISGELLWKRRIESVVAAVYGVGKESTWIPLEVVDESDVFTHGHSNAMSRQGTDLMEISPSPSTLPVSNDGGLIPYGESSDQLHRLGRYETSIFVSSKFDPLGLDSSYAENEYPQLTMDQDSEVLPLQPRTSGHSGGFSPADSSVFPGNPPDIMIDAITPPLSHRTEHGLYLTWTIVYGIVAVILLAIAFVRAKYIRQKRKWENTPSLDPTSAPSGSGDGIVKDRSLNSDGIVLPPAAAQRGSAFGDMSRSKDNLPVVRSLSLGAMASPSGTYEKKYFTSVAEKDDISSSPVIVRKPEDEEQSVATTATPTVGRSTTLPPESPSDKAQLIQQPDNIDGIPLVRYSRYRFEFKELSPLGEGGFGTVFRCENALDSREYAIKKIRIKSQLGLDGKVTKQFSQKLHRVLREVKILALLDHPNIVRYYTAWLELDDGIKNDDDDTNGFHSTLDKQTSRFFSGSLFGFGSASKQVSQSCSTKPSIQQRSATGIFGSYMNKANPLGWNNFGSFRLDESKSERNSSERNTVSQREEDIGFTWERSNENTAEQSFAGLKRSPSKLIEEVVDEEEKSVSDSQVSSVDEQESADDDSSTESEVEAETPQNRAKKEVKLVEPAKDESAPSSDAAVERRHILFIQMQLCSVQTLAHFLANHEARLGSITPSSSQAHHYAVDIPFALHLFKQIVNGVKYVHKQGLIHRDLKPQNCFIDEAGNVKVGDFGLSRETPNTSGAINDCDSDNDEDGPTDPIVPVDGENTAGVGTRAYASPEQMRGSKYDASTDVYSLGIILFEMCYPMYTTMERYEQFGGIRKGTFPSYWISSVQESFPSMHNLLIRMLSEAAAERPSAAEVFKEIDSLLGEYSVQSLDKTWGEKGAILLRVEAEDHPGVLSDAMRLIKESAPSAKILQYGLRGQASKAIMEFALDAGNTEEDVAEKISLALGSNDMSVRRIYTPL